MRGSNTGNNGGPPKIVVFVTDDLDVPDTHRYRSMFMAPATRIEEGEDGQRQRVKVDRFLPIYFSAATKEAAIERAERWWENERAKEATKRRAQEANAERPRGKRVGV